MRFVGLFAACAAFSLVPACGPQKGKARQDDRTTADERRDTSERLRLEDGVTAQLRVLETTDLHVNMEAFDYYKNASSEGTGLVRTAALIRKARAEVANSLMVDNGDLVQGSPLGDWFQKNRDPKVDLHTVYKAMNLIGYDVANVGNHEFNYGLDFLEPTLTGAKFPYVSANVRRDDDDGDPANDPWLVKPYVLLKRTVKTDDGREDEITIGVIGFAPPQIMAWDRTNLTGKVNARDIVDTAVELVPKMRAEGADLVIAVPHSGINAAPRIGNDENAVWHLAQVPGIDAILSGHSHQVFPSETYAAVPETDIGQGTIHGVPTVMPGSWGSHLGVVDLTLKKIAGKWTAVSGTGATRAVKTTLADGEVAEDVREAVKEDHAATLAYLEQEVGSTETALHTYFSLLAPSSAVQIVQDAQLWYAQQMVAQGGAETEALRGLPLLSASAPLKAGGNPGNYTDVAAGTLTLRNVADLYVYPNTMFVVKVSGAELADWLEMAAGALAQVKPGVAGEQNLVNERFPAYNFDSIIGVEYVIDVTQPARFDKAGKLVDAAAQRIKDLKYKGAAVDPGAAFLVVTNNYRANGGGSFPGLDGSKTVLDVGRESRDVLRAYVEATGVLRAPAAPGWKIAPVAGATVILRTGPRAKAVAAELGGLVELVGDDADGFARFRVKW